MNTFVWGFGSASHKVTMELLVRTEATRWGEESVSTFSSQRQDGGSVLLCKPHDGDA